MVIWLSIDTRGRIWAKFKVILAGKGWFTWTRILTQTLDGLDLIHHLKYLLIYICTINESYRGLFNEWLSICRHPTFKQTLHFHWIWRKVIFYLTVDFCIVCKMGDMRRRRPANNFLPFGNYPQQLKVFLEDISRLKNCSPWTTFCRQLVFHENRLPRDFLGWPAVPQQPGQPLEKYTARLWFANTNTK